MMRPRRIVPGLVAVLLATTCYRSATEVDGSGTDACEAGGDRCSSEGDGDAFGRICDPAELEAALARAGPGDVVHVGDCRVVGSFTVPAGVTLAGEGEHASTIASAGRRPAVRLTPGDPPARLADLAVESDAHSGILVRGAGSASVERVAIHATRGIALAAEDVDSIELTEVALQGPVTPDNQIDFGTWPSTEEFATHGLVLANVARAILADVTASGFASCGVMLVDGNTSWVGGGATANLWRGVVAYGGSQVLEDVDLSGTLGDYLLVPAAGGVFAGGTVVETSGLRAHDGANLGLVHHDSAARHLGLFAFGNSDAGVWAEECPSLELSGVGTSIARNGMGGVVALDTRAVTILDAEVSETFLVTRTVGETGTVQFGAGVELVRPAGPVLIRNVSLSGNQQVGLLVELDETATTAELVFDDVRVGGGGAGAYGALVQGGTALPGWDAGIDRDPVALANDAAPHDPLPAAHAMGVEALAADAAEIAALGLDALVDPDPAP